MRPIDTTSIYDLIMPWKANALEDSDEEEQPRFAPVGEHTTHSVVEAVPSIIERMTKAYEGDKPLGRGRPNEKSKKQCNLSSGAEAILINPPWADRDPEGKGVTIDDFAQISFDKCLINDGIIFIWSEKTLHHPLIKNMRNQGFEYIENVVWTFLDPAKKAEIEAQKTIEITPGFHKQEYRFFKKAHRTLLMFRRKLDKPSLNLRHQRTCDSCFEFVDPENLQKTPTDYVYKLIETLLPFSRVAKGQNLKLLELWAEDANPRSGWLKLVEQG